MTRIAALLLALAVFLVAGCSESDLEGDEAAGTSDAGGAEGSGETSDEGAGDDGGDDERADIVDSLVQQGFSEEASECVVDSVADEGFTLDEIQSGIFSPSPELQDAFGRAGASCLDASDLGQVAGQIDLSDPIVRDQFVKNFAASSGLSIEVAECVADFLVEEDVDPSLLLEQGGEGQQIVQDAVTRCQEG